MSYFKCVANYIRDTAVILAIMPVIQSCGEELFRISRIACRSRQQCRDEAAISDFREKRHTFCGAIKYSQ